MQHSPPLDARDRLGDRDRGERDDYKLSRSVSGFAPASPVQSPLLRGGLSSSLQGFRDPIDQSYRLSRERSESRDRDRERDRDWERRDTKPPEFIRDRMERERYEGRGTGNGGGGWSFDRGERDFGDTIRERGGRFNTRFGRDKSPPDSHWEGAGFRKSSGWDRFRDSHPYEQLPGVKKEDINIDITNDGLLTISGEKRHPSSNISKNLDPTDSSSSAKENKTTSNVDTKPRQSGIKTGQFKKEFKLPANRIHSQSVQANHLNRSFLNPFSPLKVLRSIEGFSSIEYSDMSEATKRLLLANVIRIDGFLYIETLSMMPQLQDLTVHSNINDYMILLQLPQLSTLVCGRYYGVGPSLNRYLASQTTLTKLGILNDRLQLYEQDYTNEWFRQVALLSPSIQHLILNVDFRMFDFSMLSLAMPSIIKLSIKLPVTFNATSQSYEAILSQILKSSSIKTIKIEFTSSPPSSFFVFRPVHGYDELDQFSSFIKAEESFHKSINVDVSVLIAKLKIRPSCCLLVTKR
eukprot:gene15329-18161_t